MATLDDLVYARSRRLTLQVTIGGQLIRAQNPTTPTGVPGVIAVRVAKSLDQPVPHCRIDLSRIPKWMKRGMAVTVDAGYDGLTARIFTGFVQDRAHGLPNSQINCYGNLYSAFRTLQMSARNVDGKSVTTAIGEVLDYVGITNRTITDTCPDQSGAFVLGTNSNPVLQAMPCSQMLQLLMDVDGLRIYELASGAVIVQYLDGRPAANANRQYSTTSQPKAIILSGSDREDPNFTRTEVDVTGASIPAVGNTPASTITGKAQSVGGAIVVPPLPSGTFLPTPYSNFLIDTSLKAGLVAGRLLSRFNRVPRQFTLETEGDPLAELTQTINCQFALYDIDGNFFEYGIEHTIDAQGFHTRHDLRGGDELGGTGDINPIASFSFTTEQEVVGDALYTIATFDASASFDPDGTIASYAWSDNQATTPEIATQTGRLVLGVRINPATATGDWMVTLTVTDNLGLTGSVTLKVPYQATATSVRIPALAGALGPWSSASPDGGLTWVDRADATSRTVDFKPADATVQGWLYYGHTDGRISRTQDYLRDGLTTVLGADAANAGINIIWADKNVPTRVWAGTQTGRLLRSDSNGDPGSWYIYHDFGYPINKIGTPQGGGVWVYGGRADIPSTLIQFDAGLTGFFQSPAIGGQLAAALVGASSAISVFDAANRADRDLAIIFTGGLLPGGVNLFAVQDIFADGSGWTAAVGLDAGLQTGRYVAPDLDSGAFHAAFANRDVWHTIDYVHWTKSANALPANCVPWRCLWFGAFWLLSGQPGLYLLAVEDTVAKSVSIMKSLDALHTTLNFRPLPGITTQPANGIGYDIAIGLPATLASGALYAQSGSIAVADTYNPRIATLGVDRWTTVSDPGSASHGEMAMLKWLAGAFYRIECKEQSYGYNNRLGQLQRSVDGVTWANVGPTPFQDSGGFWWGCTDMCASADGAIYAVFSAYGNTASNTPAGEIRRSMDGVTWPSTVNPAAGSGGIVHQGTAPPSGSGFNTYRYFGIVAHPNDPAKLAVMADHAPGIGPDVIYTLDGAASWGVNSTSDYQSFGGQRSIAYLETGRLILDLKYSDDYGQHTTAATGPGFSYYFLDIVTAPGGIIFVLGGGAGSSASGIKVLRSLDGGQTYVAIVDDGSVSNGTSLAYDRSTDKLYIATTSSDTGVPPTAKWLYVINDASSIAPLSSLALAQDGTFNIEQLFTKAIGDRCLALKVV